MSGLNLASELHELGVDEGDVHMDAERPFVLRAAPAFDKDHTPDPNADVLAEVFRQLPG